MDLRSAQRSPVLLVPGTTLTPDENFDWNYVPALDAMGWPVCTVELPEHALGDIQLAAEHVAYAIREAWRLSGHKVQVIGFSQGGMVPRWALRFSPDTRHKVDDLISLSGSNHGGLIGDLFCGPFAEPDPSGVLGCEPAWWQQRPESAFITTLNAGYETVPEVDYTAAYTLFDDVLPENGTSTPTSVLKTGGSNVVNISLQDVARPTRQTTWRSGPTIPSAGRSRSMRSSTRARPIFHGSSAEVCPDRARSAPEH